MKFLIHCNILLNIYPHWPKWAESAEICKITHLFYSLSQLRSIVIALCMKQPPFNVTAVDIDAVCTVNIRSCSPSGRTRNGSIKSVNCLCMISRNKFLACYERRFDVWRSGYRTQGCWFGGQLYRSVAGRLCWAEDDAHMFVASVVVNGSSLQQLNG